MNESKPKPRNPKFLNAREQVIIKHCWAITRAERDKLDHFFLVKDTWDSISGLFTYDDQEMKVFMTWEGKEYQVIWMKPVRVLKAAELLGLSFRVHKPTEIRVVLIRPWEELSNSQETSVQEIVNG